MDPSLPLFNENVASNRLNAGDAEFVGKKTIGTLVISSYLMDLFISEVFHSNAGINGIRRPIGDADYYINGGTTQPECTCESTAN